MSRKDLSVTEIEATVDRELDKAVSTGWVDNEFTPPRQHNNTYSNLSEISDVLIDENKSVNPDSHTKQGKLYLCNQQFDR